MKVILDCLSVKLLMSVVDYKLFLIIENTDELIATILL